MSSAHLPPSVDRGESVRNVVGAAAPTALACVVRRGLALLEEKRADYGALAALVEIDPVLTGAVTRVVRCPIYGVPEPFPAVAQAVELIGRDAMRALLRSVPPADARRVDVESACRLWTRGIVVAAVARYLSNQGACETPDEAYLAGLVHDVGGFFERDGDDAEGGAARTSAIVDAWRLGPRVAAVAGRRHATAETVPVYSLAGDGTVDSSTARLVAVVDRGATIASALGYGGDTPSAGAALDGADAGAVREAVGLELAHAADLLGLGSQDDGGFVAALVRAETLARRESDAGARRAVRARTVSGVAALHREIVDVRGMTAIHDMLDRGLREIHEQLDFDRLVLFETDPAAPGTLRSRTVLDATDIEPTRGPGDAGVPVAPGGAVARAMETESACRGGDPVHDREMLDRLGVADFAAASLRGVAADLGVVVADRCLSGRPVTDEDVEILGMLCAALGLVVENAALAAAGKKLHALAEKDDLTGINNRRSVFAMFQREIDRARRYGKPLSLIMIDVDHFKRWNDVHGHHVGDEMLKSVAQIISSVSRDIDVFGRYGGEEFVVVLPETPVDHAMVYAERLRATIESHGEALKDRYPGSSLSVSVGISSMNPRGDDADKMIQRADAALYAAKRHGRNRVCVDMASMAPPRASPPTPAEPM